MSDPIETEETDEAKAAKQADEDFEMVMENADRLYDLTMALNYYDPAMAKQALAFALGTVCGVFDERDEGPCLHVLMDLAEEHAEIVSEGVAQRAAEKKETEEREAKNN